MDDNTISLTATLRTFKPNLKIQKPKNIHSNKSIYSNIRKGTELYDKIEEYSEKDTRLYDTIKKSKLNIVTSDIKTLF
jgi:ketol-acid reductoisomerase